MILLLKVQEGKWRRSMLVREVVLGILGACAGVSVAGGFVALISMLGVIPRLASESKTVNKAVLYENCLILGVTLGNVVSLYSTPIPFGAIFLVIFGLFSGIFVGCLAVALAEIINTFPIFFRRMSLRKGAPYVVYALAIGKSISSFVQFFLAK